MSSSSVLPQLAAATPACRLTAHRVFPAWHGVMTLAFSGWPAALAELKARLNDGAIVLPEAPGSRWPKCTLGALQEGVVLSDAQQLLLRTLCAAHDARLAASPHAVLVRELQAVLFREPSLESCLLRAALPLDAAPGEDARGVAPEEAARVAAVLSEWDAGGEEYAALVRKEGRRASAYRGASAIAGATLVAPLAAEDARRLQLAALRADVDAALPGAFLWFDDAALHVTVRALL